MTNLRKKGTCENCDKTIYGDEHGSAHKCSMKMTKTIDNIKQSQKNRKAIELLKSWMSDKSDDEETYDKLEKLLEPEYQKLYTLEEVEDCFELTMTYWGYDLIDVFLPEELGFLAASNFIKFIKGE